MRLVQLSSIGSVTSIVKATHPPLFTLRLQLLAAKALPRKWRSTSQSVNSRPTWLLVNFQILHGVKKVLRSVAVVTRLPVDCAARPTACSLPRVDLDTCCGSCALSTFVSRSSSIRNHLWPIRLSFRFFRLEEFLFIRLRLHHHLVTVAERVGL
jgi:hypothetical protein